MSARKLKLFSDENIPSSVCRWLSTLKRVDLVTVQNARLLGREDEAIVKYATEQKRVVLAADKGLSEHNFAVCTHSGILNVYRFNTRPATLKEKLSKVLSKGRRFLDHNVVHLREEEYWVVERGNRKRSIKYK